MKRKFQFFATLMLSLAVCGFTACGDDDPTDGTETPGGDVTPDQPGGNASAMGASEAKQSLQKTSEAFMGKINSQDFNEFSKIWASLSAESNDGSVVDEWFDTCLDACLLSSKNNTYKYLYKVSNFYGEFTLNGGVWKKTGSSKGMLRFNFNDKEGTPCTITLTTSGKETQIHHESFDEYDYNYATGEYQKDTYQNYYMLPENISLTLTKSGKERMSVVVNSKVSTSGEINLTKDEVEVTTTATVGDYKISVGKAAFKKGNEVQAAATISKGGETLIAMSAEGKGSINEKADNISVGQVTANMSVLDGKATVKVAVSDGDLLSKALDNAYSNDENEKSFRNYIATANSLINAKLYLDGKNDYAANIYLSPVEKKDYYYSYWDAEPFLEFGDGSKFSYADFFTEKSFNTAIDMFERLVSDLEVMFQ